MSMINAYYPATNWSIDWFSFRNLFLSYPYVSGNWHLSSSKNSKNNTILRGTYYQPTHTRQTWEQTLEIYKKKKKQHPYGTHDWCAYFLIGIFFIFFCSLIHQPFIIVKLFSLAISNWLSILCALMNNRNNHVCVCV